MSDELRQSVQILINDISSGSPTGEDPKYLGEYEAVKNEVAKTSDRDFELVAANCRTILTKHAKDLTVLGFNLLAAAALRQWELCADVAEAYLELVRTRWDVIHPSRDRARINAIKWLNEDRVVGTFEQASVQDSDHEHLARLLKALQAFKSLIFEKLPDETPSIKGLIQAIELKSKSVQPKAAPTPAPVAVATPAASSVAPVASSAPAAAASAAPLVVGEGATRSDLQKSIQIAALQITQSEPDKALGYVLLRVNRWQDLVMPPKSDAQGKTPFAAPNKQRRDFLANMANQQSWDAILEKSESAFTEPGLQFWLDLQFYTVQALRGKGRAVCADAIELELLSLIKRVPQILTLCFTDGSAFATESTLEWIEKLQAASGGDSQGAQVKSKAQRTASLADDMVLVDEMTSGGKWSEAISLLNSGVMHGNLRERTERELAIAELGLKASKFRLAYHVAQTLTERALARNLSEWDPELAASIWRCAYKSSKGLMTAEPKAADLGSIQNYQSQALVQLCACDPCFVTTLN